ncbi:MAG: DUF6311 domain-containing protein [Oscillospiraceae bacterium]
MNIKNSNLKKVLLGMLLGAIAFLMIYGFAPINVTNDEFLTRGYIERDAIQHYTGWMLYRDSPWQYPIGVGSDLQYPVGASVAYTDSIPLFAIIFKALSPILPKTFQYFGIFAFMSFAFMGASAALLLGLFTENFLRIAMGVLPFVFSPIMIERAFRHTALSAQFLIVISLYVYFKNQGKGEKTYTPYIFITIAALAIHPYFLPLCYAVMFADVIQPIFQKKSIFSGVKALGISLVITVVLAHAIGFFYTPVGAGISGEYGYFSWNLNSFFNPTSKGVDNWSRLIPPLAQLRGNYESFTYLGLGVLIAFPILFILNIKHLPKLIKENFALLLCCIALAIFAITGGVTFFAHIRNIPLPQKIVNVANTFRASGRMMWLLWYLIVMFTSVWLIQLKIKYADIALLIVCAVQLFDISGAILEKHRTFSDYPNNLKDLSRLESPFWENNINKVEMVESFDDDGIVACLEIANMAAKNGVKSRLDIGARYDIKYTKQTSDEVIQLLQSRHKFDDKILYVSDNLYDFNEFELYDDIIVGIVDKMLVVTSNKNIDTSGMKAVLPNNIFAESLGGVSEEKNVISIDNRPKVEKILENADTISNERGEVLKIKEIKIQSDYIEIYVEPSDIIKNFAYNHTLFVNYD